MIHLVICAGLLLAPGEADADDALARQVSQLVRQLDAQELTQRDQAESRLRALGPDVLPLLPATGDRTSAEVALRLSRLRQHLRREQALAATRSSVVTLKGNDLPLADVLEEISKQTGNPISDHRPAFGQRQGEVRVTVDFDKTPYWKALDSVLDQAELTLYGFTGRPGAFVVNRPPGTANRADKASYVGIFRLEPVRFEAQRDLRNESLGSLRLFMEVSWEPRLQPMAIVQPLAEVRAVGNSGEAIPPASQQAELETLIRGGMSAAELAIPFALPKQGIDKISSLKGKLTALIPGPLADFRFDELPLEEKNGRPKPIERRQAGTTVALEQVRKNNDVWQVQLRVRLEAPGAAMESHRGWIFENEAYFEDHQGNRVEPGGLEHTRRTKDEVGMNYVFDLPDGPQGLSFVYRTPLVILEAPLEYEFHDLRLP